MLLGDKGQETLEKEVKMTCALMHKNIVRQFEFFKTQSNNYLVFEFCEGGDLRTYLKENGKFSEIQVQRFLRQIGSALKYLY